MRKGHRALFAIVYLFWLYLGLFAGPVLADAPGDGALAHAKRWLAGDSAAKELLQVWKRAREAGSYRFVADVEQTLFPRPVPDRIGESETAVDLHLEDEAHLPDRAMLMLRVEADGISARPLTLYRLGDQVFLKEGGELRPVDDPAGLGLVDADYLGYLAGAVDVRRVKDSTGPDGSTHLRFRVDGARLARYQRERLEEQLRARGSCPRGQRWSPMGSYRAPRERASFGSRPRVFLFARR